LEINTPLCHAPIANKAGIKRLIGNSKTVKFNRKKFDNYWRKTIEIKHIKDTLSLVEACKIAKENKINGSTVIRKESLGDRTFYSVGFEEIVIKPERDYYKDKKRLLLDACCDSTCIFCGKNTTNEKGYWENPYYDSTPMVFKIGEVKYRAEGICENCAIEHRINTLTIDSGNEDLVKILKGRNV